MQPQRPLDKYHSLPNLRRGSSSASDSDFGKLYSLSLSQIRRHFSDYGEYIYKPAPFNLRWIYGYNPKVGVVNLNNNGRSLVFYAASNCGVLYDWVSNQMRILQGHKHAVTCIAKDNDGKWLVTADSGSENVLIVWDSSDYFPIRCIYAPHGNVKIGKVALSADAKYLLTLGYPENTNIRWWIWALNREQPHAMINVDIPQGGVVDVAFNPFNSNQFLLMTTNDIWLGVARKIFVMERGLLKETDDYELKIRMPPKKTVTDVGKLTSFVFVKETSQILVATRRGAVLVYGYTIEYQKDVDASNFEDLRFIKVLKVEQHRINVIKYVDGVIVTGNRVGDIRFYDAQMKLLYWVHDIPVDCVKGLSFNINPRPYEIIEPKKNICVCWEKVVTEYDPITGVDRRNILKTKVPTDATVGGKPLIVRDFVVCTKNQGVGLIDFVGEKLTTIIDSKISYALSISVHPEKPYVCIGFNDGVIEMHNFVQHKLFKRLDLREHFKVVIPPNEDSIECTVEVIKPNLSVTCLKYSPSGLHLACGLNTGELLFLNPVTLDILNEEPLKDIQHSIKLISYSRDSLSLVVADAGRTVAVYKFDCKQSIWKFIGKHRSHYKDIKSVFFLPKKNDDGEYKVLSLGADRIMVEYDIGNSSEEHLEIFSLDRIDQNAVPLAGMPWPTPKDLNPIEHRTSLPLILIANNENKFKIVNSATTMTLSTVLGPRYEHPVNKMQLIKDVSKTDKRLRYLLFSAKNVIGIMKLPLDGNPWKHVGMLGHPVEVIDMCFRNDYGALFTIGAKDNCVIQWATTFRSVETTTKQGGGDLDPYYCLIEDGRPGWLFHEIRDLFYYIQILCQGTFSPAMRRVKDYIPIDSLPDMMRALGFFPTEYEVENLIVEAKYKVYQRRRATEIDFEEFVKLYINHRPAFGDSLKFLRKSFGVFSSRNKESYVMSRDEFIDMLTLNGECFSRELAWYLLSILYGQSFEDRALMTENDFSFLPEEINFSEFVNNIIGIQESENLSEYSAATALSPSEESDSDEPMD